MMASNENLSAVDVAAALAAMLQGGRSLLLKELPSVSAPQKNERTVFGRQQEMRRNAPRPRPSARRPGDENMERFRVQVGASHGLKPSNLVGAIANEADLSSKFIGRIEIFEAHSIVDLPMGMPRETFRLLEKVRVCNRPLNIQRMA
jgi:ATP-dependent RNA helicase DeaD